MASNTPVKVTEFLSPSSKDICIICFVNLQTKYKGNAAKHGHRINLWKAGEKTEACHAVERFLQCTLNHSTDLKCICRPCYNNIKKGQNILQENMKQMESSKAKAGETFMRTRVKRGLASPATEKSDSHQEKTSTKVRRSICFHDGNVLSEAKV